MPFNISTQWVVWGVINCFSGIYLLWFSFRYDGCSRNVYRYDDLKDVVSMNKISDHFIFTVESTGALLPENLVVQAIDILADKCDIFLNELDRNVKKR